MSTPATVTVKMLEVRRALLELWGVEKYRKTIDPVVEALKLVAAGTGREPLQAALDEVLRAGREGARESVVWQLTAAACEIARADR